MDSQQPQVSPNSPNNSVLPSAPIPPTVTPISPKRSKAKIIIISIAAVVFVLLGIGMLASVPQEEPGKQNKPAEEAASNEAETIKEADTTYVKAKNYPIRLELADGIDGYWSSKKTINDGATEVDNSIIQVNDGIGKSFILVRAVTKKQLPDPAQTLPAFASAHYAKDAGLIKREGTPGEAVTGKTPQGYASVEYEAVAKGEFLDFNVSIPQIVRYVDTGDYFLIVETYAKREVLDFPEEKQEIDGIVNSVQQF